MCAAGAVGVHCVPTGSHAPAARESPQGGRARAGKRRGGLSAVVQAGEGGAIHGGGRPHTPRLRGGKWASTQAEPMPAPASSLRRLVPTDMGGGGGGGGGRARGRVATLHGGPRDHRRDTSPPSVAPLLPWGDRGGHTRPPSRSETAVPRSRDDVARVVSGVREALREVADGLAPHDRHRRLVHRGRDACARRHRAHLRRSHGGHTAARWRGEGRLWRLHAAATRRLHGGCSRLLGGHTAVRRRERGGYKAGTRRARGGCSAAATRPARRLVTESRERSPPLRKWKRCETTP